MRRDLLAALFKFADQVLAAFPYGQVGIGRRVPTGVDLVALEDTDPAGGTVHDPGMFHAVDRDAARGGNTVRDTVVARGQTVLFEPGDGEAGVCIELALDTAQIFVETAYAHGSGSINML